jgi:hypothetical protein
MRSVFNTEDASLLVRLENQAKLKVYMADKPFGAGVECHVKEKNTDQTPFYLQFQRIPGMFSLGRDWHCGSYTLFYNTYVNIGIRLFCGAVQA